MASGRIVQDPPRSECVVVLKGEFDIANASDLEVELTEALAGPDGNILVDMCGVTFMDSIGLHVLIRCYQRAQIQGGYFVLMNPPSHIRKLLNITSTDYMMDGWSPLVSQEAAIQARPETVPTVRVPPALRAERE